MKDGNKHEEASVSGGVAQDGGRPPALQVICLGSSGGPSEENVTGFLVRSIGSAWAKGSLLAVDAGSHLAPIIRILENDFPLVSSSGQDTRRRNGSHGSVLDLSANGTEEVKQVHKTTLESGPFAGLTFPNASARANALYVLRNYISTYLITHPHLDHISGFTINTAAFHATSRPKTLAALPSTVDAIKQHIFNDVIWPNLSDEDGGVGFVTFQRLKEGGDVMLGEGEGRGYIDVCDGLGVKAFKVSHGVCTKSPPSHHHRGSLSGLDSHLALEGRSLSQTAQYSAPGTPSLAPRASFYSNTQQSPRPTAVDQLASCVVDSTSYFVRDCETQREVLIFGDVEPDSISLSPRNRIVWQEAARKIVHGLLGGIFIESSYDDSQVDAVLFGHLNPKHLIAELQTLATLVVEAHVQRYVEGTSPTLSASKKRKRSGAHAHGQVAKIAATGRTMSVSPKRVDIPEPVSPHDSSHETAPRKRSFADSAASAAPLAGVRIVIIHIKDTLKDGPEAADIILTQLREHEARLHEEGRGLGCEFIAASSGQSYWF